MSWLDSGSHVDTLIIEGANILELDIEAEEKPALSSSLTEPFVDPAIVSYGRPEDTNLSTTKISPIECRPSPPTDYSSKTFGSKPLFITHAAESKPTIPFQTKPKEGVLQQNTAHEAVASATLAGPFNDISIQDPDDIQHEEYTNTTNRVLLEEATSVPAENGFPAQPPTKPAGRRNRRGTQRGKAAFTGRDAFGKGQIHSIQPDLLRDQQRAKTVKDRSQAPPTVTPSHFDNLPSKPPSQLHVPSTKRKSRRHLKAREDRNGWATGEASDIQDMGDFDFEGNLSKFDKRKVFEKIRQEDTTADEERLVSFNRVHARPGTNGGKNLHYSENVLDSPNPNGHLAWNNGDSEDEMSDSKLSSRRSSRRNLRRRKTPSRKGSAIQTGDQQLVASSLPLDPVAKARYSSNDQAGSPQRLSNPPIPRLSGSNDPLKPSLRILPSNRTCPSLTPLQMVELEQLAMSELGLTEDMITENAGRGIAETARKLINVQSGTSSTNNQIMPLIFIMAGNHRSGARAIAAGRHLLNHHTRVVICVLGHEREEHLIDSVRRQLVIYRNCGGLTSKPDELVHSLQHLQAPRSLIIDALLGIHASFDDLRMDDQAAYSQLGKWANSAEFSALSIDIPSGLDASSGKPIPRSYFQPDDTDEIKGIPTVETDLVIHADFVLSLGAPKIGLLTALNRSPAHEKWGLFLTDIGINNIAWEKFGTKRSHGVDFGSEWVMSLRYKLGED